MLSSAVISWLSIIMERSNFISEKRFLRKEALKNRRSMSHEERVLESRSIAEKVISSKEFQQAETVFAYVSVEDEVHTEFLLAEILRAGKKLFVPYIRDSKNGDMTAVRLRSFNDLVEGAFGILTAPPYEGTLQEISADEIDLVIAPGVAFDGEGHRIGMGGGYYDRFLGNASKAVKFGLAYKCQFFESIPVENHDKKVDKVILP